MGVLDPSGLRRRGRESDEIDELDGGALPVEQMYQVDAAGGSPREGRLARPGRGSDGRILGRRRDRSAGRAVVRRRRRWSGTKRGAGVAAQFRAELALAAAASSSTWRLAGQEGEGSGAHDQRYGALYCQPYCQPFRVLPAVL